MTINHTTLTCRDGACRRQASPAGRRIPAKEGAESIHRTLMKPPQHSRHRPVFGALLIALVLAVTTARAALMVDLTTSPLGGGIYQYTFTIANTGPDDVAIVSIVDAPLADPLIDPTLTWPVGFLASYDGGLGFVDFLEGTSLFSVGTSFSGFSFQSEAVPGFYFTEFTALTVNGEQLSGSVNQTITVPESGGTAVFALLGLLALALWKRGLSSKPGESILLTP